MSERRPDAASGSEPASPESAAAPARSAGGGGLWVVGLILIVSTGLAIFASFRFRSSEVYLSEAYAAFEEKGSELGVRECVDSVLSWRVECEAMKSLCDSNVERMTDACLGARDRAQYCEGIGARIADSHFAAASCREHGVDRSERAEWKFCGMAYRAVDLHCRTHYPAPSRE